MSYLILFGKSVFLPSFWEVNFMGPTGTLALLKQDFLSIRS